MLKKIHKIYNRFYTTIETISYNINSNLLIKDLNHQKNELNKTIDVINKIKIDFLNKSYFDDILINLIKTKNYNNEIIKILNKTNKNNFENITNDIIMNSIYYKNYDMVEKIFYIDKNNIKKLFNDYYLKLSFFKNNEKLIYLPHKNKTFFEEILIKNVIEFNKLFVKFYNGIYIESKNKIMINGENKIIKIVKDKNNKKINEDEIIINEENFNFYYNFIINKKSFFVK